MKTFKELSFKNIDLIKESENCGCYHCIKIFKSSEINKWTDNNKTAICPYCGVDSVIPDSSDGSLELSISLLRELNKIMF